MYSTQIHSNIIKSAMKHFVMMVFTMNVWGSVLAQDLKSIVLFAPDKTRGLPVMQAFSVRASVREYSERPLALQDLSDLVWAAKCMTGGVIRDGVVM
jgi:hypothetical protein